MTPGTRTWLALLALAMVFARTPAAQATMIFFEAANISGNTWEYSYTVENDSLGFDIEEFTVFFDVGVYENLVLADAPAGWDPLAIQPDTLLPADGFYDALALISGVAPGTSLAGFSVQFDFLGTGTPGAQPFTIVDPFTFETVDSGSTQLADGIVAVPEPGSFWLLLAGLVCLSIFPNLRRVVPR